MLPARHPPLPGRRGARPRQPAVLGRRLDHRLARCAPGSRGRPVPRPARPGRGPAKGLRKRYDDAVAFGIIHNRLRDWGGGGATPATPLAAGCASTRSRSGCSRPPSRWSGRTTPSAPSRDPSAIRPSPGTGTPTALARWVPCPAINAPSCTTCSVSSTGSTTATRARRCRPCPDGNNQWHSRPGVDRHHRTSVHGARGPHPIEAACQREVHGSPRRVLISLGAWDGRWQA